LVIDGEDGTRWVVENKGTGIHLITNHDGHAKGARRKQFPYRIFEDALLTHLRGVTPSDLIDKEEGTEGDKLKEVSGKIAEVDVKMAQVQAAIIEQPDISSLIGMLSGLERKKKELVQEYEIIKQALATPVVESMTQVQTLVDMLKASKDVRTLRQRLRAKIATVVKSITVWVEATKGVKTLLARIDYRNTTIFVEYTHAKKGRGFNYPEKVVLHAVGRKPRVLLLLSAQRARRDGATASLSMARPA
jgi:hypothetical protein